ncbi:metallophosphoesterase family protein [Dyadobacter jiangsuensis]|uniref:Calcineurin-like phosphoesterase family protein n=1 Tax=Dyadobacter jiangsuensis TaxID=1591085 RepID=A0A2P8FQ83_9BACT|nr:metallophosphoesterase [Dyadobacter jiangsuensis]PSL23853.1 calcineurin-like phosphoesterase family protein [Dyadobacter jiangsuensis]
MKRRLFLRAATISPLALPDWDVSLKPGKRIRFGICADLHNDLVPDGEQRLSAFIETMNDQKPDFIIQMGDFCMPKESNRPLMAIWDRFSGPKYHVIGNHETDGGFNHRQVVDFWQAKGTHYAYDAGGYHFVVLNGNEKNPNNASKGYPRYIGQEQRKWLAEDLAGTKLPTIIFCHQGIDNDLGGIEEAAAVRRIFEKANEQAGFTKVRMVFSGHHHQDYHNLINGIHYVQINSMSYFWAGESRNKTSYDESLLKKYPHLRSMLRYKEPIWALVTIYADGSAEVAGKQSGFMDATPSQVRLTEEESVYPVVPFISTRRFRPVKA